MRPFLVTELQAGKLPRWALLALCALYVLPGFVGRDPWRTDDAAGFGVALTMARGGWADWLLPNIAGEPVVTEGPLPFWIGAAFARALPFVSEHSAVRAAAAAGVAGLLVVLWYAVYALVKRPGVLPSDPFGASATRVDFGRAVADSAILILLASLGVVAKLHETASEAAQMALVGLCLYALAVALERPARGGALAGAAIAATVATRGLVPAAALLATACALPAVCRPYRLGLARWLPACIAVAAVGACAWPAALATIPGAGERHLAGWLEWNRSQLAGLDGAALRFLARTLPWYFWPAWPMAAWALWRWRGRLSEPAVSLPLTALVATGAAALATAAGAKSQLPLMMLPLAMLAAVGLPTLTRAVVSLIDWFAVMTYSVIGFVVWAYWLAFVTGYPPKMAFAAARIAPGFEPRWLVVDVVLGVAATLAWIALVRWRVSRQPPMIWRAVVLSSGGLVLAWSLLMTLWLPAFDARNTYRDVAQQVAQAIGADTGCVATRSLGPAQRASLYYFGRIRFGSDDARCPWTLAQDDGPLARTAATPDPGWRLAWEGSRLRDPDERLRLYRRAD